MSVLSKIWESCLPSSSSNSRMSKLALGMRHSLVVQLHGDISGLLAASLRSTSSRMASKTPRSSVRMDDDRPHHLRSPEARILRAEWQRTHLDCSTRIGWKASPLRSHVPSELDNHRHVCSQLHSRLVTDEYAVMVSCVTDAAQPHA